MPKRSPPEFTRDVVAVARRGSAPLPEAARRSGVLARACPSVAVTASPHAAAALLDPLRQQILRHIDRRFIASAPAPSRRSRSSGRTWATR